MSTVCFIYLFLFYFAVFSDLENANVVVVAKPYGTLKPACNKRRDVRDQDKDYDDGVDCSILRESNEYMRSFMDNSLQFASELANPISPEDFVGPQQFDESMKEALRRSLNDEYLPFPEDSQDLFLAEAVTDFEQVGGKSR